MKNFVLKGNIIYAKEINQLVQVPDGYLVCKDGKSAGVYTELPLEYQTLTLYDYEDKIILPGFVDLHTHAPQYAFRGLGMDQQLLEWLNTRTFPEEEKYKDLGYAHQAYQLFTHDLKNSLTTRACIFATVHEDATLLLMDLLEQTGLKCMVGKVNMDRNCPDYLSEHNAKEMEERTRNWLSRAAGKYQNVKPILTPRFIPTCSDEAMVKLSAIQKEFSLPMQSHMSENLEEIAWVKELCPSAKNYGDAYNQFDLFGRGCPTIMAHCVYPTEEELEMIKKNEVFLALCSESNTNLASGIAPIGKLKEAGIRIGLGSDIAAGSNLSMFKVMVHTIQASKLYWRVIDNTVAPIGMEEAFFWATKGGGSFFGKIGSFEEGYELDAVVLDDSNLTSPNPLSLRERLERLIYLSDDRNICSKYVAGIKIMEGTSVK